MEKEMEQPALQLRQSAGNCTRIFTANEDAERQLSGPFLHRSRRRILLCGLCLAILLLLGAVAIILAFTVFQVMDPTLSMNAVFVRDIQTAGDGSPGSPLSVNATVVADISVRNPNVATLHFGESMTTFYMDGRVVGSGEGPGARVGAKDTVRMNVSMWVETNPAAVLGGGHGGFSVSIAMRIVRVKSRTEVAGRVSVLGVFKRDVSVSMDCNLSLDSNRQAEVALSKDCAANVS